MKLNINDDQKIDGPNSEELHEHLYSLGPDTFAILGKGGEDYIQVYRDEDGIGGNLGDDDIMNPLGDDDSFARECPSEQIDSPSQMHCSSIQSPPSEFGAGTPSFLAEASQSPILQCSDGNSINYEQSMEFRKQQSPPLSTCSSHRPSNRRTRARRPQLG